MSRFVRAMTLEEYFGVFDPYASPVFAGVDELGRRPRRRRRSRRNAPPPRHADPPRRRVDPSPHRAQREREEDLDEDLDEGEWWDDPEDEEVLEFGRAVERLRARRQRRSQAKPLALGRNLRVAARAGVRAGSIEVRPGMWLVFEVPEAAVTQDEVGLAPLVPLLAPVVIKQAAPAIQQLAERARERRAERDALLEVIDDDEIGCGRRRCRRCA